jgi:hypothetical protein
LEYRIFNFNRRRKLGPVCLSDRSNHDVQVRTVPGTFQGHPHDSRPNELDCELVVQTLDGILATNLGKHSFEDCGIEPSNGVVENKSALGERDL